MGACVEPGAEKDELLGSALEFGNDDAVDVACSSSLVGVGARDEQVGKGTQQWAERGQARESSELRSREHAWGERVGAGKSAQSGAGFGSRA
jgi:hypothetical protein